jgi:hypothetical protein
MSTVTVSSVNEIISSHMDYNNLHMLYAQTTEYAETLAYLKAGFKELTGSEKQVEWAKKLREEKAANFAFNIIKVGCFDTFHSNLITDGKEPAHHAAYYTRSFGSKGYEAARKYARVLVSQDNAKFYIDNRDNNYLEVLNKKAREAQQPA